MSILLNKYWMVSPIALLLDLKTSMSWLQVILHTGEITPLCTHMCLTLFLIVSLLIPWGINLLLSIIVQR